MTKGHACLHFLPKDFLLSESISSKLVSLWLRLFVQPYFSSLHLQRCIEGTTLNWLLHFLYFLIIQ